jgi:hypothetical protein
LPTRDARDALLRTLKPTSLADFAALKATPSEEPSAGR